MWLSDSSMTGRYSDYEEFRPLGEATHIPDDNLSNGGSGKSRRQRIDNVDIDYPDAMIATMAECTSCGTSIPTSQTKCRFCLTNHLDASTDEQDTPGSEYDLLNIIYTLVESRTFYGAVAKGSAAASLLAKSDSCPVVDDFQLIYDLDEEPAAQLADQWPSLPPATRVTSECGTQLLAAVRERTTWTDTMQSHHNGEHATFLYDETASSIRDEECLVALRENADDDVWLVPAIALERSAEDTSTEGLRRESPNREYLKCRECNRETNHRFYEFEDIPDDEWTGQPMWECQVCGTPRYGPEPEAD
jgi:ribosomal protein L40E